MRLFTLQPRFLVLPKQPRHGQFGRAFLPATVALVLAVALVLRAGLPLWSLVGSAPAGSSVEAAAGLDAGAYQPDLAALQALDLFAAGPAPAFAPASAALPAVNSALNLRLEGVVLAGNASDSRAIIVSDGQQASYRAGDTLPTGAGVLLESIALNHVIINNRGLRETLALDLDQGNIPNPTLNPAPGSLASMAPGLAQTIDQRVLKTAATLAQIIHVEPAQENGYLIGYRLTPGEKLKEFVQLGFRINDIVTAANGIALNDMANVPQLYSLMNGATEVSFSLLREGAPLTLKVVLNPELTQDLTSHPGRE